MNKYRNFINIIILSWGFMLVFTAFQTMGNIQKTVLESIAKDDPSFHGDGYTSLAIIYGSLAICNWLAPSIIAILGTRCVIILGCSCYVIFIATFLWPKTLVLYLASGLLGFGAALAWTGHGHFLTKNSTNENISTNSGLFWAIFQLSLLIGNLVVYFVFTEETITASIRNLIFKILTTLSMAGLLLLLFMRRPAEQETPANDANETSKFNSSSERKTSSTQAWEAFKSSIKLMLTSKMILLIITFIYTGLVLTFYSGVYSSSIGFTKAIGSTRKSLVGLSGALSGLGEIVGGIIFGIYSSKLKITSSWAVVLAGAIIHSTAFISIVVNLPNDAPFQDTDALGFIKPLPALAIAGSFMLGLGDACFNTQIYVLLGTVYHDNSTSAFALFKFFQSVAAALSFLFSNYLGLYVQIGILFVSLILGTSTFCITDIKEKENRRVSQ